ncbi:MAG: hypothetical protein GY750_05440 [Lentisphaerae bacterium]|nr:hypothetical protein [Lentisphaerota bacterium]
MYALTHNGVIRLEDRAFIPANPANLDYQEYLEWVAEGNEPRPLPPSAYHKWSDTSNEYVADTSKKQELLQLLKAKIDVETDENILNGFLYKDKSVKLSLENQMNYKAEYDMRELLTYPHKIKADNEYVMLESFDEYAAFYVAGVQYIRSCIEAGWNEKDTLDSKTTAELIEYMNNS